MLAVLPLVTQTNVFAGGETGENSRFVVALTYLPETINVGGHYVGASILSVNPTLRAFSVETQDSEAFLKKVRTDGRVRYVEPDPIIPLLLGVPSDPLFPIQYGPSQTLAPAAWEITTGTADAAVCIVDTGVRYTHEDLSGPRWLGGTDFANGDTDPWDDHGHGTHVAGIAAASMNNLRGIAGMGQVGVYGVKVLDNLGFGAWSWVADGITWCADNTMDRTVISMSLGGTGGAAIVADAVSYAYDTAEKLLVAAAGNDGPCFNCVLYPAAYEEVMAVTCTDPVAIPCWLSSQGPEAEIAAPGDFVISTWAAGDDSYEILSGTSMSAPHVSGAAALYWSHNTAMSNTDLRTRLRDSAKDLGPPGRDTIYGCGELDVESLFFGTYVDCNLAPPPAPSSGLEDFDDGAAQGWTLTGLWHISNACSSAASPPNYLGYNQDGSCTYNTGAANSGTATFEVDLTGKSGAILRFDHRFTVESFPADAVDIMQVQVSTDGGSTWTILAQWDSMDPSRLDWAPQQIDLTPYVGGSVLVRFSFDTVDPISNGYLGWLLDNVLVLDA